MTEELSMPHDMIKALDQYGAHLKEAIKAFLMELPDNKLLNLEQVYVEAYLSALGAPVGGDLSEYYIPIILDEAVKEVQQLRKDIAKAKQSKRTPRRATKSRANGLAQKKALPKVSRQQ